MRCWIWLIAGMAYGASLEPRDIVLAGPGASQRMVATGDECRLSSSNEAVVRIVESAVTGRAPGTAEVRADCRGQIARVRVEVRNQVTRQVEPRFSPDIISILTIKGCNGSGCHGSPAGQSGFKLSLFGYDVEADHAMVAKRINAQEPEKSLLLRKPLFDAPHGGGRLLTKDSEDYRTLLTWLRHGAKIESGGARLLGMEMYPRDASLMGPLSVAVIGRMDDGTTRDMTREVRYESSDASVAKVSSDGVISAGAKGMATILARGMGQVAAIRVSLPSGGPFAAFPVQGFVDELAGARLQAMGVKPAPLTTDTEFLRRVFLDTIGRPPLPAETREFLAKPDRKALIDRLLAMPEYASFWTVKFEDWFRNNQLNSQGRAMGTFKEWIRGWLADDRPYDQIVRELVTSEGDSFLTPATAFWAPATDFMLKKFEVNRAVPTVTRLFLGVRLECAECHNHPLENFTQDDFYGLSAFFARMRVKHGVGEYRRTWYLEDEGEVTHPVTKKPVAPKLLGGSTIPFEGMIDRRTALADWITSPSNPFFARATVNRIWHEYFQTGIVEPYDDFRMSNPPTNPELLDRLADHFVRSGYRLKAVHRAILNSRIYQLSSRPAGNDSPEIERLLFARYQPRKLPAEVLLDSLSQVAGTPHVYANHPKGMRAMDIYMPDQPDAFLTTFGFPRRDILCERSGAPTLGQTLHLMNGKTIQAKVEDKENVLRDWEAMADGDVVTALYERAFARRPSEAELGTGMEFLRNGKNRRKALEGMLWATLVSKEFQLNY